MTVRPRRAALVGAAAFVTALGWTTATAAAAQTDPTAPAGATTAPSTTISVTTTTACVEPQPQFPFVGTVRARDGDRVTFAVQNAPLESPIPAEITVIYPDQGRYLDVGGQYYVVALGPEGESEEAGAGAPTTAVPATVAPPADPAATAVPAPADPAATTVPAPGALPSFLFGRVKLDDGQCGALTRHADGTGVDTAVLKPFFDNWSRVAWAVVVPLVAVVAALMVIVAVKRLFVRAVLGPVGPPAPRRPHGLARLLRPR